MSDKLISILHAMPALTTAEYFERKKVGPILRLLGKPCHDCAVVDGFYREISDELKQMDRDTQVEVSRRWFCHNHPDRACRGNAEHLGADIVGAVAP